MTAKILCSSTFCLYHAQNSCTLSEVKIGYPIPKCMSFCLSKERFESALPEELVYTQQELSHGIDAEDTRMPFIK